MFIKVIKTNFTGYHDSMYDLDDVVYIRFDDSHHLFQIVITHAKCICKCNGDEYVCRCLDSHGRFEKKLYLVKYKTTSGYHGITRTSFGKKIIGYMSDIILSDVYDIFDVKTLIRFYKYINIDDIYVDSLCGFGKTETLDLLMKKFGSELKYSEKALNNASKNGHVKVLEWWVKSNLPLKYSDNALCDASKNGHVNVLEWWVKSNLPLKYDADVLRYASSAGHVNVLEWWKNSGLYIPEKYSYHSHSKDLTLKYSEIIVNTASVYGHVNVLEWWKNSGYPLEYNTEPLDSVSSVDALEWWKNSGLPLKYTYCSLYNASFTDNIDVLEWWKNSGLPLKYDTHLLNISGIYQSMRKLPQNANNWWRNSGLPFDSTICISIIDGKVIFNNNK
jgi:hypothetical protein